MYWYINSYESIIYNQKFILTVSHRVFAIDCTDSKAFQMSEFCMSTWFLKSSCVSWVSFCVLWLRGPFNMEGANNSQFFGCAVAFWKARAIVAILHWSCRWDTGLVSPLHLNKSVVTPSLIYFMDAFCLCLFVPQQTPKWFWSTNTSFKICIYRSAFRLINVSTYPMQQ